ncbi:MAG: hypothetical protein MZW92_65455 [Comamonadaceae bacterium]|nr:hypothetical protein [Comamonadaceae bacterium]
MTSAEELRRRLFARPLAAPPQGRQPRAARCATASTWARPKSARRSPPARRWRRFRRSCAAVHLLRPLPAGAWAHDRRRQGRGLEGRQAL